MPYYKGIYFKELPEWAVKTVTLSDGSSTPELSPEPEHVKVASVPVPQEAVEEALPMVDASVASVEETTVKEVAPKRKKKKISNEES